MVRGLALAETTPGPLIMVVQFVAFLGAYRNPGDLDPLLAGVLGALLTTWVTFVPSFLFIFLGAPYVERLRGNRTLRSALDGVTASIVGVIANLALFFAIHTLFSDTRRPSWGPVSLELPVWSSYVWEAWLVALVAGRPGLPAQVVGPAHVGRLRRARGRPVAPGLSGGVFPEPVACVTKVTHDDMPWTRSPGAPRRADEDSCSGQPHWVRPRRRRTRHRRRPTATAAQVTPARIWS